MALPAAFKGLYALPVEVLTPKPTFGMPLAPYSYVPELCDATLLRNAINAFFICLLPTVYFGE